ncbi:energy-coupling factor ABC transporter ATP-binding protein [Kocuria sp.]|uniref:energy-coupling factor ABC transporter ATP-binding protein n=1 Tax=Kocuria sp. TaxID=1871328 RepID=UPI0026DEE1DC|nr:ABC transporter ATP-binding protein [Kocuria sp.]MDO5617771.1 ABC transporter ATP-binding protein [Kocuria sp.]
MTVRLPPAPGDNQDISILDGITFHLDQSRTAILGLNGSGKSTVLRLLNGLVSPSEGSVTVHGVDVVAHRSLARRTVGFVFTDPTAQLLMPTALEDVELSLRTTHPDPQRRRSRALALLAEAGLAAHVHQSVYDLSGGQRQLAALTSVLAVDPSVVVLDEPTTLLDLRNRARLMDRLRELPQQLVYATHDLELAATAQQVVVIHQGRVHAHGGPELVDQYLRWCIDGFPGEQIG